MSNRLTASSHMGPKQHKTEVTMKGKYFEKR